MCVQRGVVQSGLPCGSKSRGFQYSRKTCGINACLGSYVHHDVVPSPRCVPVRTRNATPAQNRTLLHAPSAPGHARALEPEPNQYSPPHTKPAGGGASPMPAVAACGALAPAAEVSCSSRS